MKVSDLYDLEIAGGDLAFGPDEEPRFLTGARCVAQDLRHRLRASGLPPGLLGAAEADKPRLLAAVAREAEEDQRIRPGTARAEETVPGQVRVTARTVDGELATATTG